VAEEVAVLGRGRRGSGCSRASVIVLVAVLVAVVWRGTRLVGLAVALLSGLTVALKVTVLVAAAVGTEVLLRVALGKAIVKSGWAS